MNKTIELIHKKKSALVDAVGAMNLAEWDINSNLLNNTANLINLPDTYEYELHMQCNDPSIVSLNARDKNMRKCLDKIRELNARLNGRSSAFMQSRTCEAFLLAGHLRVPILPEDAYMILQLSDCIEKSNPFDLDSRVLNSHFLVWRVESELPSVWYRKEPNS